MRQNHGARTGAACGCIALVPILIVLTIVLLQVLSQVFGLPGNEVAYIGAGILVSLFFPAIILAIGVAVGLLWAPFAALICGRVARSRGYDGRKYAVAGAVYSTLFFWPWVYLVARLYNRTIPASIVRGTYYMLLGVIWPTISLGFIPLAFALPHPFWIVCILLLTASGVMWIISMRKLAGWREQCEDQQNSYVGEVLPHRAYMMPFAYTFGWLLVVVILWWQANWVFS